MAARSWKCCRGRALLLLLARPSEQGPAAARQQGARTAFAASICEHQERMAALLRAADPAAVWARDEHGSGVALVLEGGEVWEKGCMSVTLIDDLVLSAVRAEAISARTGAAGVVEGARYSAAALSFVLHSRSPLVPTLRGDVRWFRVGEAEWYGGGLDLTPSYLFDEDCAHFHASLRGLCEAHGGGSQSYAEMKRTCDEYFFLPARAEHRGVGGIFFDDLSEAWAPAFALALLDAALHPRGPYMPLVERRRRAPHTNAQRQWQLLRRGRYVEFNLLYDRGVRFGLSPESVERVLVSSPPLIAWRFRAEPEPGTPEAEMMAVLRQPRDWC